MENIKFGILMWCLVCCCSVTAQTATLYGHVTDAENGEPILFGNVALFQNGVLVTGVETDFDGNYRIDSLTVGVYDVEAYYVGYRKRRIENVQIVEGKEKKLDISFKEAAPLMCVCSNHDYLIPLIEQDNNTQGQIFTSDQLRHRGRAY